MSTHQPHKSIFTLGSRYPRQIGWLRIVIGIYLVVLTAILYSTGHGGRWAWLLLVAAALHFALAGRLFRIAYRKHDRRLRV
ncbi:MAG TPA: hypothetical protein VMF07_13495 [Solirubrobacteraceae bacterium]|nr:hypothetical protein [Solirubrobacteraceae bacterium]